MSKQAEQRSLEVYPVQIDSTAYNCDINEVSREIYQLGYEQAEKDLALTWEDIQLIDHFILQLVNEEREGKDWGDGEKFYTEVLNRFNKSKEEK